MFKSLTLSFCLQLHQSLHVQTQHLPTCSTGRGCPRVGMMVISPGISHAGPQTAPNADISTAVVAAGRARALSWSQRAGPTCWQLGRPLHSPGAEVPAHRLFYIGFSPYLSRNTTAQHWKCFVTGTGENLTVITAQHLGSLTSHHNHNYSPHT